MATATSTTERPVRRPVRVGRVHLEPAAAALVLVGLLFFVLQHVLLPRPFGFSTDEVTYLAKVDPSVPELYWTEPRAWGTPVLAAPIAVFSPGVEAVRLYFSLLSSAALVGAFWPWLRILRPAVAPLAALLFATSWVALFFGPQVMPNLYVGLGAVALVGLFLRAVEQPTWRRLVPVALVVAVVALVRPTDSVLIVAPVVAVALLVRRLRRPAPIAALVVGGILGWLQWLIEAFVRFGDPLTRLQAAEEAGPKGLGLDLTYLISLPRLLDGNPYYFSGSSPEQAGPLPFTLSIWLFAVVAGTVLGLAAAATQRRMPELLLVVVPAAVVAGFYLLLPSFTSIRFLVPAFALLALPVATALVHGLTSARGGLRRLLAGGVALGLAAHVAMMLVVADHNLAGQNEGRTAHLQAAEALRPLVEREHCLVVGQEPQATAFYLGCRVQQARPIPNPQGLVSEAIAAGEDVVAVLANPPAPEGSYLLSWEPIDVPGLPEGWRAYVPPS